MPNKILWHVNILYSAAKKWILRSFTTVFDAFLHLPDLNVRPTQIYNICLKIKKKEKYVCNEIRFPLHLWKRVESELECIAAYLSIFKVAILRRQQQKYRLYKNKIYILFREMVIQRTQYSASWSLIPWKSTNNIVF